ncbi:hypothetical protein BJ742DRAFT_733957 [Cladochytrium replicatum]|nr:hypothetical protein BJ742DRAFT_733957 [Cladochytrium replicatum]
MSIYDSDSGVSNYLPNTIENSKTCTDTESESGGSEKDAPLKSNPEASITFKFNDHTDGEKEKCVAEHCEQRKNGTFKNKMRGCLAKADESGCLLVTLGINRNGDPFVYPSKTFATLVHLPATETYLLELQMVARQRERAHGTGRAISKSDHNVEYAIWLDGWTRELSDSVGILSLVAFSLPPELYFIPVFIRRTDRTYMNNVMVYGDIIYRMVYGDIIYSKGCKVSQLDDTLVHQHRGPGSIPRGA